VANCRGPSNFRSIDYTDENAKSADAEVRDAIVQANKDENEFLRKWGAEAFFGIACR
jgi:hypothetical protein